MKTTTVYQRVPGNYNDFGTYALSEAGLEKFDNLISEMIPEDLSWCGDEIIGPVDFNGDFDVNIIIDAAREKMISEFGETSEYWEEI